MSRQTTTAATTPRRHSRRRGLEIKITAGKRGYVKKIGGRVRWLAPLDQPELARQRAAKYLADHAEGRVPRPAANDRVPLKSLMDLFIDWKSAAIQAGELRPRTCADYNRALQGCADFFGKFVPVGDLSPADWQRYRISLAAKLDPHSLLRYVGAVRALSRWAYRNEYIDRPFRFGDSFDPPRQSLLRKVRKDAGKRQFQPEEVKRILAVADPVMSCMFLLALNGGFGNTDLASLPLAAINFKAALVEFDRPKTGVERRCPLWPETVAAIREAMRPRTDRKIARRSEDEGLLFLTPRGHRYVRDHVEEGGSLTSTTDAIGMTFAKLATAAGVSRSFYDARRTFRTIADDVKDRPAVDLIMGHTGDRGDMGRRYVQEISLHRLKAITDHVRSVVLAQVIGCTPATAGAGATGRGAARAKRSRAARA